MSQLKEQNGKYYQQCNVVMLATEKVTNIIYRKNDDILIKKHTGNSVLTETDKDFRNIYVTSNEEIKEGDWFIVGNRIHRCMGHYNPYICISKDGSFILSISCRKIIATTDETLYLTFNNSKTDLKFVLPKPSDSFISKYIEEYNKGNQITDVLVEYKWNGGRAGDYEMIPKIDSDNTITIKKVKDSYSREEVIEILGKMRDYCKYGWKGDSLHRVFYDYNNWIKENL